MYNSLFLLVHFSVEINFPNLKYQLQTNCIKLENDINKNKKIKNKKEWDGNQSGSVWVGDIGEKVCIGGGVLLKELAEQELRRR